MKKQLFFISILSANAALIGSAFGANVNGLTPEEQQVYNECGDDRYKHWSTQQTLFSKVKQLRKHFKDPATNEQISIKEAWEYMKIIYNHCNEKGTEIPDVLSSIYKLKNSTQYRDNNFETIFNVFLLPGNNQPGCDIGNLFDNSDEDVFEGYLNAQNEEENTDNDNDADYDIGNLFYNPDEDIFDNADVNIENDAKSENTPMEQEQVDDQENSCYDNENLLNDNEVVLVKDSIDEESSSEELIDLKMREELPLAEIEIIIEKMQAIRDENELSIKRAFVNTISLLDENNDESEPESKRRNLQSDTEEELEEINFLSNIGDVFDIEETEKMEKEEDQNYEAIKNYISKEILKDMLDIQQKPEQEREKALKKLIKSLCKKYTNIKQKDIRNIVRYQYSIMNT